MRTLTRKILIRTGVLAVLVLVTLNVPGRAAELAGATLPDTLSAGDKTLKLNGFGLRKKSMFKVYVGGLYLESPSKDAGTILAADQAKAIRMHFLRDLTKAQLVEARSIVAVKGDGPPEQGDDGVVKYTSAHIDGVASELIVRSGHSTQATPETIEGCAVSLRAPERAMRSWWRRVPA